MKAHIIVQFRIPVAQGRLLKEAAKRRGLKLATWVREAAVLTAETNPDLTRNYRSRDDVAVIGGARAAGFLK